MCTQEMSLNDLTSNFTKRDLVFLKCGNKAKKKIGSILLWDNFMAAMNKIDKNNCVLL